MSDMRNIASLTRKNTHGHAAFIYDSPEQRLHQLASYFREGLDGGELCVFVTAEKPQQAMKSFQSIGFDTSKFVESGALRIYEMNPTYLPNGTFAADYMMQNVRSFQQEAQSLGFTGLRTAGEMTWLYEHPESTEHAAHYEAAVNDLSAPNFIGLCLYPMQEDFPQAQEVVIRNHPILIFKDQLQLNPYYA